MATIAQKLRKQPTEAEKLLWSKLRGRQLCGLKFRRQVTIGRYVADFACLEKRMIIELDGGQHSIQAEQDRRRTTEIEGKGFLILRFWNNEVFENIEGILQTIAETAGTFPSS